MSACIGPIVVFPSWWSIAINVLVVALLVYAVVRAAQVRRTHREIQRLAREIRDLHAAVTR